MRHMRFTMSQIVSIPSLTSILLIPLLIQMAVVQATPETVVEVEPYMTSANVGEQITINITVVDVQNLYGVEVALYWNSSILETMNINIRLGETDGILYGEPLIVEDSTQKGKYVLAATSQTPAPSFNGSGSIVRITFNVTNRGDSKLDLETQLYDYPSPDREPRVSLPIEHTTIDGFANVIPEIPQIIILPLLIVLTIFAIILSKKIRPKKLGRNGFVSCFLKQNLLVEEKAS